MKASVNSACELSNTDIGFQRREIFVRDVGVAGRAEHPFSESEHPVAAKNFAPTTRNKIFLIISCGVCVVQFEGRDTTRSGMSLP